MNDELKEKLFEALEDQIFISITVENISDLLMGMLDLDRETSDRFFDLLYERAWEFEDEARAELINEFIGILERFMDSEEIHEHPEDAPWQLHLFE